MRKKIRAIVTIMWYRMVSLKMWKIIARNKIFAIYSTFNIHKLYHKIYKQCILYWSCTVGNFGIINLNFDNRTCHAPFLSPSKLPTTLTKGRKRFSSLIRHSMVVDTGDRCHAFDHDRVYNCGNCHQKTLYPLLQDFVGW